MSTYKHIDRVCAAILAGTALLALLFANGGALGIQAASGGLGYEERLFDTGRVHTIDIVMDGWEDFIRSCEDEAYASCTVVIDGEACRNVGIRAKGNTSLTTVSAMGSSRYSFKVEFDCYDDGGSYHGLDKLCLNNSIQDTTFMKDYLTYRLMAGFGVDAPLCSYAFLTVNGEDWGLYLAVEGVEEAFLRRNYGRDHGALYKPDSMDGAPGGMGGGSGVRLQYTDDDPDSYADIFDSAKTDITGADQARLIQALKTLSEGEEPASAVDVEQVLRYFVVHNFVRNGDSYTGSIVHNYYLYEKDGRMSMIPWDYNLAFGTFQSSDASGEVNAPIDSPVSGGAEDSRPMVDWIFSDEAYKEQYHQYFAAFLESADFAGLIDETAALIAPYVERDPTKFYSTEEFEAGTAALRTFCQLRAESVSGQLEGTIPSTAAGQAADASALVDASGLDLSDMGSMGGGGFPGGGSFPGGDSFPGGEAPDGEAPDGFQAAGGGFPGGAGMQPPELPDGTSQPGELPQRPDRGGGRADFPGMDQEEPSAGPLLLGVSLAVLLAGLVIAFKFRR